MLGAVGTVLLLIIGLVCFYALSTVNGLDKVTRVPLQNSAPPPAAGSSINIALMGSDSRGADRGRSDVLQLLHISGDRKGVYLMSIPRDSWVPVPGHGDAKINAAYSWGGPSLTVQTMQDLLGARMDHTAIIDFPRFVKVIDALGGITVTNREASSNLGFDFPAGPVQLTGESALAFVRERYGLSDGDFGRARRQRDVVQAVLMKLASAGTLSDPIRFRNAVSELGANFTVDDGLSNDAIVALAWELRDLRPSDIKSFQMPVTGFDRTKDGQSIVLLNQARLADLKAALQADNMGAFYDTVK